MRVEKLIAVFSRRGIIVAGAALTVAILAGCGGDDSQTSATQDPATTRTAPAPGVTAFDARIQVRVCAFHPKLADVALQAGRRRPTELVLALDAFLADLDELDPPPERTDDLRSFRAAVQGGRDVIAELVGASSPESEREQLVRLPSLVSEANRVAEAAGWSICHGR